MKKHRYLFLFVIPLLILPISTFTTKWNNAVRHQRSLDSALLAAVKENDFGKVKHLCSQGANPSASYNTASGSTAWFSTGGIYTALGLAINKKNTQVIKYLIAQGADVNALTGGGTPLHYAIIDRDVTLVRLLLASGADVNVRNGSQMTPLEMTPLEAVEDNQRADHWRKPGVSPRQKAEYQEIKWLLRAAATNQQ